MTFNKIKLIWDKLDNYKKATLIAFLIGLILVLCIIGINPDDLLGSHWFFSFIIIPTFIGSITAGFTYLARIFDDRHPGKYGSFIGACIGTSLAITLMVLGGTLPFSASLYGVACIVFTLGYINNFSGLAHRLETVLAPIPLTNDRPKNEKWAIGITIMASLIVGIILVSTSSVALVSVAGVTTFLTGGFAAPIWLLGAITLMRFVSISASFADYFSKAVTLVKSWVNQNDILEQRELAQRKHEYRGSLIGISVGTSLGIILVVTLAIIQPTLFVGGFGILLGLMVTVTCGSVFGGWFSRAGRAMDGCLEANKEVEESANKGTYQMMTPILQNHSKQSPNAVPLEEVSYIPAAPLTPIDYTSSSDPPEPLTPSCCLLC